MARCNGTTTWSPLPPVVLTNDARFNSLSSVRSSWAPSMTADQSTARVRIEIEDHTVRTFELISLRPPGMQLQDAHLNQPHQRRE